MPISAYNLGLNNRNKLKQSIPIMINTTPNIITGHSVWAEDGGQSKI